MLADFITNDYELILDEWEKFARSLSGGENMSAISLRDHGKEILESIADDMRIPQNDSMQTKKSRGHGEPGPLDRIARIHSALRLRQGFEFNHLMAEFRALRATVIRLWEPHIKALAMRHIEHIIRFNEAIDQVLTEAVNDHVRVNTEYRDRFVRMLGHDLRTPLAVINLSASYAQRSENSDPKYKKALARVLESAKRLERMASNLLDFTRTRFGPGIPLSHSPTDLVSLCETTLDEIRVCHPSVEMTFEHSGNLNGVWDRDRVAQVISNLVVNAIRYGDSRRPVNVYAHADGDEIEIDVHNEGAPIPDSTARDIFDPFVCDASKDLRKFQGGLGLGLCIIKEIVAAHSGKIALTSAKKVGTTFSVLLPRYPVSNIKDDVDQAPLHKDPFSQDHLDIAKSAPESNKPA